MVAGAAIRGGLDLAQERVHLRQMQAPAGAHAAVAGHGRRHPLERAQQALRSGQPQRCIEILDEAIRQGSGAALALRRRADCYEAAGQRQRAIEDYQRFCRLVPDHPSVGEVRPLLESWGRSCP